MASSILFQLHLPIPIPHLAVLIPTNSGMGIEAHSISNSGIGPNPGGQGISSHGISQGVFHVMLFEMSYITAFLP